MMFAFAFMAAKIELISVWVKKVAEIEKIEGGGGGVRNRDTVSENAGIYSNDCIHE